MNTLEKTASIWNGQMLNESDINVLEIRDVDGREIFVCKIHNFTYACLRYKCTRYTGNILCLLNEMKRYLNIPAPGLLRYKSGETEYILSPYSYSLGIIGEKEVTNEMTLVLPGVLSERTDLVDDPVFRIEMQNLLIFREIFGIHTRRWDNIEIRPDKKQVYHPVCIIEAWDGKLGRGAVTSTTAMNKWFKDSMEFKESVSRFLRHLNSPASQIGNKLTKLCEIISTDLLFIVTAIQTRVNDILPSDFTPQSSELSKPSSKINKNYIDDPKEIVRSLFENP